jgi:hypothetical protein
LFEYSADGTLIVATETAIVTRAADGTLARQQRLGHAIVSVSPELPGVVVAENFGQDGTVALLATPTLQTLYAGPGSPIAESQVVIQRPGEILLQHGSALLRLALPSKDTVAMHAVPVASGTRINVTVERDVAGQTETAGLLYDSQTGALVGPGLPLRSSADTPRAAAADRVGFVVEGHRVARIALDSGKVVRKGVVRCPPDDEVANPTPDATGSLLLVTCAADGVVLDGVTLAERRRIRDIIPGCDNGPFLGGSLLDDGHTLLVGGCGGEARLDLARGRYVCSDAPELIGKPYPMMGAVVGWQPPPDRAGLPRCSTNERLDHSGHVKKFDPKVGSLGVDDEAPVPTAVLGRSQRYRGIYADRVIIEGPAGRIELEEGASEPEVAPDERSLAYAVGARVVVRTLPDGRALAQIEP